MTSIDNIEPHKSYHAALDTASRVVENSEATEKLTKILFRGFDFIHLLGFASTSLQSLSSHLKNTVTVFEGLNFLGRVKELACPDEKGVYFFRKSTLLKIADRIFLTASSVFKMMNAGIKFGFIHLAQLAKMTFGRIPLLRLIPDVLVAISSSFSLADNAYIVRDASKKVVDANVKSEKWSQRAELIGQIRQGNAEAISKIRVHYQGRIMSLEKIIDNLDPDLKKVELAKANAAYKKYLTRLEWINDEEPVKLADELAKHNTPSYIAYKQAKWSVVQHNENINLNKAWISIAGAASKIFVISVASAMTTLNLLAVPYALSLLAIGITVDSIGLTKTLYEFSVNSKPLPVKPDLS